MKKILILAVLFSFLFMPPGCFAQKVVVADNDLGAIFAQLGSFTVTFENITINSKHLKTISTNFSDFWGKEDKDATGYFGFGDVYLTGGLVERSGSLTLRVDLLEYTSEIPSRCKLFVNIDDLTIKAHTSIEAAVKLGTRSDLTTWSSTGVRLPDQVLGHAYIADIGATINGGLSVYATTNTFVIP